MSVEFDKHWREAKITLEGFNKATQQGIHQAWFKIGDLLRKETRDSIIKLPKSGRLYRIAGRKRRHRASAPYEPPANLSGTLQRSIGYKIAGSEMLQFGVTKTPQKNSPNNNPKGAYYASYLENGTSKMTERPYLIRAIEKKQGDAEKLLAQEIEKAIAG